MQLPTFPFSQSQVDKAIAQSVAETAGKRFGLFTFGGEGEFESPSRFAVELLSTRFGEPTVFVRDADIPDEEGLSTIIRQYNTVADYNQAVEAQA